MTLHQEIDEALRNNPNGWCSVEKGHNLASLVIAMGGGNVCELGVWGGRSFIPMALAVQACGNGKAYGIDPFTAEAAIEGQDEVHEDWWKRVPFDRIEEIFLENLAASGAQEWCEIIKKKSDDVEPPKEISVLHIDANHELPAIRDVTRFAPNVVLGGFCCLDDVGWSSGAVSKAVEILHELGFVERRRVVGEEKGTNFTNDFAVLQRITYCK